MFAIGAYFKYRKWNVTLYCKVLTNDAFAYVAWSDPPVDHTPNIYRYITTDYLHNAKEAQPLESDELFELQLLLATTEAAI